MPKRNPRTGAAWRKLRATVLAEEDRCARCGRPVNKNLSGNHKWGATVGHVVELDRWPAGLLVRSNVRLEHRHCNITAGAIYGGNKQRRGKPKRTHSRHW